MSRLGIAASSIALGLAASGCAGSAPTRPTNELPNPTQIGAVPSPTASAAPSSTPHGEILAGGAVSYAYDNLAQFIRDNPAAFIGVAVVAVDAVSSVRWNTLDGTRPPEPALDADWSMATGAFRFTIGRAVSVRLERVVWGTWTAPGPTDVYFAWGGRLGADEVETGPDLEPLPVVGGQAVALVKPFEQRPDVLGSSIAWLFPVDANGRVTIPLNPTEDITLSDLRQHLP